MGLTTSQMSSLPTRRVRNFLPNATRRGRDLERWVRPLQRNIQILFGVSSDADVQTLLIAILAFTGPGFEWSDNTVGSFPGWEHQAGAFHEIGPFQIPAGPASGPPCPPDPNAKHNAWTRLARSMGVRRCLGGRAGIVHPDRWKTEEAREDHLAIGTAMLAEHYRELVAKLPDAMDPSSPASVWGIAVLLAGFSAGSSRSADVVTIADDGPAALGTVHLPDRYTAGIETVREEWRWSAVVDAYARAWMDGVRFKDAKPDRHGGNPMHTILSTWQKLALAHATARALGWDTSRWDAALVLGQEHEQVIRAGAAVQSAAGTPLPRFDWQTGRCLP